MINRKTRFATEGVRLMRNNPDGTLPTKDRLIGFANTADLSAVLTTSEASLSVSVDGVVQTKDVDFTAALDEEAVTVAEAVTALNAAAFTGFTFSADTGTGRLKAVSSSGSYVQIYGPLAAALDFGQGIQHGGNGLQFIRFFNDEAVSIGLPKSVKEKEEIDLEGANGAVTRMVIGSKLLGMSPVLTLKVKDYDLLELVQGGTYDRVNGTYDPPTSDESEHPVFHLEVFSPIYAEGINKRESVAGYERLLIRSCIGMEGDVPIEAKAWAQYAFNIEATEYTDAAGVKYPAYQEATLTSEAFDALAVETV